MRVFLTGATGFVGSHVLEHLLEQGLQVAVLMRPCSNLRRIAQLLPRVQQIAGDLAQPDSYGAALRALAPQAVLHLGWGGVGPGDRNDIRQLDNVQATLALVRAAGAAGAAHFVALGSQAEYGPHPGAIAEDAPTRPTTTYGAAKLAACLLAEPLCAHLGLRFAWLRLFSAYGPGDHPYWMIPTVVRALLHGERPALTEGRQHWDFLHVDDAADAICRVLLAADARGVFILASGHAPPLRETVETIRDLIDPALPLGFGEVPYRGDQVMHLQGDVRRLRAATGWTPRVALAAGLTQTIDWYRAHEP